MPTPYVGDAYYVLGLSRLSCVDIFCTGSTADGACLAVVVYSARLHARGSSKHCTVISAASARDTKLTFSGSWYMNDSMMDERQWEVNTSGLMRAFLRRRFDACYERGAPLFPSVSELKPSPKKPIWGKIKLPPDQNSHGLGARRESRKKKNTYFRRFRIQEPLHSETISHEQRYLYQSMRRSTNFRQHTKATAACQHASEDTPPTRVLPKNGKRKHGSPALNTISGKQMFSSDICIPGSVQDQFRAILQGIKHH